MRALAALLLCAIAAPSQERPILLKATTILDGRGGILKNAYIVVNASRIASVGKDAPPGNTYDLSGLTVMPGWIDTHVHITAHFGPDGRPTLGGAGANETPSQAMIQAAGNAYRTLLAGFTTVQSVGAPADRDLRDAIAAGVIPGPRLLTSLRAISENTGDPERIRAFVRQVVAEGADVIKLFATKSIREGGERTMSAEQIQAACGEARAQRRRAVVHAHSSEAARDAVLAGCTSIEHGALLNDATLALIGGRGVYFDPNFLVLHNYLENKPKFLGIGNYTEEGFAWMAKSLPLVSDVLRRAMRQKVKVVLGTDAVAGAHGRNFEEFVYRVSDAGQPPMEAIVSATSLAAESLGLQDKIGAVAPGYEADLIATDGNPLEDISAVRRVVFVMKGGQVYKNVAPAQKNPRSSVAR